MLVSSGRFQFVALGTLVLGCSVFAACAAPVDLSAVAKYASTTAQAGTSFAALAADFKNSCVRYNRAVASLVDRAPAAPTLITVGEPSPTPLALALTIDLTLQPGYVFKPPAAPASAPAGSSTSAPRKLTPDPRCTDAADVSKAWDQDNAIVLAYVQALGNLANVDAIPTPNPSPLASALTKIGASSAAVTAGSALVGSISSFFQNQAQQRSIAGFVTQVNPLMAQGVEALEVVDAAYSIELENEFTEIGKLYGVYAQSELGARNKITGSSARDVSQRDAITRRLLSKRNAVVSALAAINQRRQASLAYGSAIEQILRTHEDLYAAAQRRAKLSDFINIIRTTGAPVLTNLDNLAKAVK